MSEIRSKPASKAYDEFCERAGWTKKECPNCKGKGVVPNLNPEFIECWQCKGKGTI